MSSLGRLYLLPVSLGAGAWHTWLPPEVRQTAHGLRHFIAENAKSARAELKSLEHPVPLRELSIEQLPSPLRPADIDRLLAPLRAGDDVAIVSEAGCPAIADPGASLVRRAHELGIRVIPLVGPSAILLTLMASGLDGQRFAFHGYLPAREPQRSEAIRALEKESAQRDQTQLFIETPYRNMALLDALLAQCQAETLLCLGCDVSLSGEAIHTRRIAQWRRAPPPDLDKRPTVFALLASRVK